MAGAPVAALQRVPLFSDLNADEVQQIALLFKERHFVAGETVVKEGADGAAFFLIESGDAAVSVAGKERANLGPGDHFGEIALIDEGVRSATITATSELVVVEVCEERHAPQRLGRRARHYPPTLVTARHCSR